MGKKIIIAGGGHGGIAAGALLAEKGFDAVTDSVQKTQKDGMRFAISLTEGKRK